MKRFKSILSILLSLSVLISAFPLNVFAVEGDTEGESLISWKIDDESDIIISGEGDIPDYEYYGDRSTAPWDFVHSAEFGGISM